MATDATPLRSSNIKDIKTQVRKINLSVPFYDVTADANGVMNVNGSLWGNTPTEGMRIIIRPTTDTPSPKLSLNSGNAYAIYIQTTTNWGENPREPSLGLRAYNVVELVFINGYWRCLNIHSNIAYSDLNDDLRHQIEVTRVLRNVNVTNDTPTGWYNQFGAGVHFVYYDTAGCFESQPYQYGFLEVLAISPAEISLVWHRQSAGYIMLRAGNSSTGWAGAWHYVVDTSQTGTVSNAMLADNAVTRAKIGDGAVGTNEIADESINTAKIQLNAVTANRIANGAIIHDKLSDTSVWNNNLGAGAVTAEKISNGTISLNHFQRGTDINNNVVSSNTNVLRFRDRRIMWGSDTVTVPASGQVTKNVTFPENFVNNPHVCTTGRTNVDTIFNIESKILGGFQYRCRSSHGAQYSQVIDWIAIG